MGVRHARMLSSRSVHHPQPPGACLAEKHHPYFVIERSGATVRSPIGCDGKLFRKARDERLLYWNEGHKLFQEVWRPSHLCLREAPLHDMQEERTSRGHRYLPPERRIEPACQALGESRCYRSGILGGSKTCAPDCTRRSKKPSPLSSCWRNRKANSSLAGRARTIGPFNSGLQLSAP